MFLAPQDTGRGGGHLWQQQQCLVIRLRAHKEGESPGLEDKQENCPTDPGREYNTPKAKHCFIFTGSLEARTYFLIFQNLFVTASSTARSFDTWLIDSMHCRCNLPIQYGVHRQGSWKLIYFDGSSNESSQERPSQDNPCVSELSSSDQAGPIIEDGERRCILRGSAKVS